MLHCYIDNLEFQTSLKSENKFGNQIGGVIYEISLFLIGRLEECNRVDITKHSTAFS